MYSFHTSACRRLAAAFLIIAAFAAIPARAGPNLWTGSGPDGGRATRVLVDPSDGSRMYALGAGAGLFVSDDAAATWARLTIPLPGMDANLITDIAIDPNAPATLYVAAAGSSVARSIDGGATWTQSSSGLSGSVYYVYADPTIAGTVYATASSLVFKSTDNGLTFSDIGGGLGLSVVNELVFHEGDASLIYALGWEGVFKSVNGGATWAQQANGLPLPNASGYIFANVGAIDPLDADTVYVSISNEEVYKTVDGGVSWSYSGVGVPSDFFDELVIDPNDSNRIYMATGNNDVIVSTNAGASWQSLPNNGLGDYTVRDLAFDPLDSSNIYAATFTKGVFLSTDGGANWSQRNTGFVNTNVESLAIDAANGQIIAGVFGGVSYSNDDGQTWTANGGDYDLTSYAVEADPLLANHAYAGSSCCGLYETFDGGDTWARIDLGLATVVATWVTDIDIPASDQQRLYFTDYNRGLFATIDGAQTFTHLTPALQPFFTGNVVLEGVDAVASQPDTIYVSSSDFSSGGVFRSANGGQTWARIAGSGVGGPTRAFGIATHPTDPDIVYVGTNSGMRYSIDGGANWLSASQSFGGQTSEIYVDDEDPQLLYAVADNANLFRSIDGGDTWTEALDFAGSPRPNALVVDPANKGRVLVGFNNVGVREYSFATDISLAAVASTTDVLPGETLSVDMTLTNNGPLAATAVTVSNTAPDGFAVVTATSSQGGCSIVGQQIECELGVLGNAASASVNVSLEGVTPGSGSNTAGAALREADLDETDNSSQLTLSVIGVSDTDGDGVADSSDNCLLAANASQLDADGDGYGNVCDADLNNDCIANVIDLGILKSVFFTADPNADFNGDGIVNVIDLGIMKALFFTAPGPAGAAAACD